MKMPSMSGPLLFSPKYYVLSITLFQFSLRVDCVDTTPNHMQNMFRAPPHYLSDRINT